MIDQTVGQAWVVLPTVTCRLSLLVVGAGEIPRRVLEPCDVVAIVGREVRERREAASAYVNLGREDAAGRLHREAEALESLLQMSDAGEDS